MHRRSLPGLRLKAEVLQRCGLRDLPYPVSADVVLETLATDWRDLEPAMDRLSQPLTRDNPRKSVTAEGENGWLENGWSHLSFTR